MGARQRFRGRIAGVGSASGVRVVVGWWHESPFGPFADAMVETAAGHRVLVAPSEQVRDLVAGTYEFDETRIEDISASHLSRPVPEPVAGPHNGSGGKVNVPLPSWSVESPSLRMTVSFGSRMPVGRLLRLVPGALAASPTFATVVDPVARIVLPGVRTRGVARAGRRGFYGATDLHAVTSMTGSFDGIRLGELRPVDPPCRFGFSSTPRRPSVADVVTTIVDT